MLSKLLRSFPKPSEEFVVMVNNLGGLTQMEMLIVQNEVIQQLSQFTLSIFTLIGFRIINKDSVKCYFPTFKTTVSKKIKVHRCYSGPFMTSLNMRGFHISLLKVTDNKQWLELLDIPTDAPGWTSAGGHVCAGDQMEKDVSASRTTTNVRNLSNI